jgi:flagellar biosynthesis/type III secretory pathway M-ring protein FliF/YscJ
MVRATLNLDKRVKTEHQVLPGAPTSKSITTENLSGGSLNGQSAAMGPAGVAANTNGSTPPTYSGPNVNAPSGKYTNETSTMTSVPSTSDINTVEAPGEIKNAYVIVTLDKKVAPATAVTLKQQIPIIMGEDPTAANSGIRVSVETADFDTKAQELDQKAAESAAYNERMNRMLGYGVPLGVMLLMLFLLSRAFRKSSASSGGLLSLPGSQPQLAMAGAGAGGQMGGTMGGLDILVGGGSPTGMNVEQALNSEGQIIALGGETGTHTYDVISETFDSNLESIMHLAKSKPETVALLLKTWQQEEKNR